jgi:hypothetical protein
MTMNEVLTIVVSVIPLVALAWRSRCHVVRERRRQDTLDTLTSRVPPRGVVEIHDVRDDGSYLRVRIAASLVADQGDSGART